MTVTESIQQYVQMLPDELQQEVLDFVKFLVFKRDQEITTDYDDLEWTDFSVTAAMRGMEDEDTPVYTLDDLKEVFE